MLDLSPHRNELYVSNNYLAITVGEVVSFHVKVHLTIDFGDNIGLNFYSSAAIHYFY